LFILFFTAWTFEQEEKSMLAFETENRPKILAAEFEKMHLYEVLKDG